MRMKGSREREKVTGREGKGILHRKISLSKGMKGCLNMIGLRTIGNSIVLKEENDKR